MKSALAPAAAFVSFMLSLSFEAHTQEAPAAAALPSTGQAQAGDLGFDDLMTVLIQPRHLKLYYSGAEKNWELAAAELRDLRSGFFRISQRVPRYLNNDVEQAINVIVAPKLRDLDAAIAAADSRHFLAAYSDLTAACNACHVYMEHPFLVIQVPGSRSSSTYPDQDFHTRTQASGTSVQFEHK